MQINPLEVHDTMLRSGFKIGFIGYALQDEDATHWVEMYGHLLTQNIIFNHGATFIDIQNSRRLNYSQVRHGQIESGMSTNDTSELYDFMGKRIRLDQPKEDAGFDFMGYLRAYGVAIDNGALQLPFTLINYQLLEQNKSNAMLLVEIAQLIFKLEKASLGQSRLGQSGLGHGRTTCE